MHRPRIDGCGVPRSCLEDNLRGPEPTLAEIGFDRPDAYLETLLARPGLHLVTGFDPGSGDPSSRLLERLRLEAVRAGIEWSSSGRDEIRRYRTQGASSDVIPHETPPGRILPIDYELDRHWCVEPRFIEACLRDGSSIILHVSRQPLHELVTILLRLGLASATLRRPDGRWAASSGAEALAR